MRISSPCSKQPLKSYYPMHAIRIERYRDEMGTEPERHVYKTVGSEEVFLMMMRPAGDVGELRPAVIWIHGGGWCSEDSWRFTPHLRYSIDRRAVGIALSYRKMLQPLTRANLLRGPQLGDCLADCVDGVRFVKEHAAEFGIDPNRIAVIGDSAGGHLAVSVALGTGVPDAADVAAVVNCNGVIDLTQDKWMNRFAHCASPLEAARKLSPIYNLGRRRCPVLNLNGDLDTVVTSRETTAFHQACLNSGIPSELVTWPDVGHAFILPYYHAMDAQISRALQAIDDFLIRAGVLRPCSGKSDEKQRGESIPWKTGRLEGWKVGRLDDWKVGL